LSDEDDEIVIDFVDEDAESEEVIKEDKDAEKKKK
jgi:hypothetical protein